MITERRDFLRTGRGGCGRRRRRARGGQSRPGRRWWRPRLLARRSQAHRGAGAGQPRRAAPQREDAVEAAPGTEAARRNYTHLEAFGRLLAGISPWLELEGAAGEEARLRERYADLARRSLDVATDPRSRDFMNFNRGGQPVVDTAFLAQAILRAPRELWQKLDTRVRANVVAALKATRVIKPNYSNWLLFSAIMVEEIHFMVEPTTTKACHFPYL